MKSENRPTALPLPQLNGIAATAHPLATDAACEMLRAGGNAIDAAVAAAWALSVCEPGNSGIGGQTIMLIRLAGPGRRTTVLEGHSRAPRGVSIDTVSRQQQRIGYRATTVPTTPLVLDSAHRQHGRLPLAKTIEPAIRLAEEGFLITRLHRRQLIWCLKSLQASPSATRLLLNNGLPYEVGQRFHQAQLAETLRRIARFGVDDFYRGGIARGIAADMQQHGGLLTLRDLLDVDVPVERKPIAATYRGYSVLTVPPPAGGFQILRGMRRLELADLGDCELGDRYEAFGEATYAAFSQRESEHSLPEGRDVGREWTHNEEPGETTHLCTADSEGNVVSLTQSIQSLFGSRTANEACGFLYNNYLTTCPRQPHRYQLAPGCRPRSNSAPTLVSRGRDDGARQQPGQQPASVRTLALGGAGSRRATSAILQTISGVVDGGRSMAEAVDAPRFHVKLSRRTWLERSPETEQLVPRLSERYRTVQLRSRYSYALGCIQAIQIDGDGTMTGAADPRREGTVGSVTNSPESGTTAAQRHGN